MFRPGDKVFCVCVQGFSQMCLADVDEVSATHMSNDVEHVTLKNRASLGMLPAWRFAKYDKLSNGTVVCPSCNWKTNRTATIGGSTECLACFLSHMAVCLGCHSFDHIKKMKCDPQGVHWCPECFVKRFFSCPQCHRHRDNGDKVVIPADCPIDSLRLSSEVPHTWCTHCFNSVFMKCRHCHVWRRHSDVRYCERSGGRSGYYCLNCVSIGVGIHSYNHKPQAEWRKIGKEKDQLFFGFELEVENHGKDREWLEERACKLNQLKYVYCKHDGSLSNGFEIVSHPATWGWLQQNREYVEDNILSIRDEGFISYDARMCGLHIHASKKPIGAANLFKLQKLIFEDPQFTLYVSRRTKEQLDQYASTGANPDARVVKAAAIGGSSYRGIRGALSLLPQHTVEFRLFRGTLRPESFWRAFEFVRGSIMYVKDESLEKVGVLRFAKWIADHKAEYPRLHAFLDAEKPDDNEKVPVLKKEKPVSESPRTETPAPVEEPGGILVPADVLLRAGLRMWDEQEPDDSDGIRR